MKNIAPFIIILSLLFASAGCGKNSEQYDNAGMLSGSDDKLLFARGSQQYFRGRLSDAKISFETMITEYPESALLPDADLALRRINADLSAQPSTVSTTMETVEEVVQQRFPSIAIVSNSNSSDAANELRNAFVTRGSTPLIKEDPGAANLTIVLYSDGMAAEAQLVADSLTEWISSHTLIQTQPGDTHISNVFPGHTGVLINVGSDITTGSIID